MATSNSELRRKKSTNVIKIPNAIVDPNEPGPLTKDKLVSLWIVYFSVFLDFMGASIVQPILPFYAEKFDANATELGALYSSYAFMTLLSTLFMGKFSDKWGRKPMILFSLFGTTIGFLCTGLAQNYAQLLAFRFLTGFFGGTAPVANAYITDVVPSKDRPKYIPAVGATVAAAFVIGPAIGSGLAEFGIRIPFFASSGLGAFGFIFALIVLRESHPDILRKRRARQINAQPNASSDPNDAPTFTSNSSCTEDSNHNEDEKDAGYGEMERLKSIDDIQVVSEANKSNEVPIDGNSINNKIPMEVWIICVVYFLSTIGFAAYTSMFALYVIEYYGLRTIAVGYITLCLALTVVLNSMITFRIVQKCIGMYVQTIITCFLLAVTLCVVPFIDDLWAMLAVVVFGFGTSWGQIAAACNSMVAEYSNKNNRGILMAMIGMARNLGYVIGPMVHGYVYTKDNGYPFFVGAICCLVAGVIMMVLVCKRPELRHPKAMTKEATETETDWVYQKENVRRKDYMKLGKGFGTMLSNRNYLWASHIDQLFEHLDTLFPPNPTDSLQSRRAHVQFIMESAQKWRSEYDNLGLFVVDKM
eukprot:9791_1